MFIEKDALTCYQSVSVVAVSDVEARYVVCVLLPILLLTYLKACSELVYCVGAQLRYRY